MKTIKMKRLEAELMRKFNEFLQIKIDDRVLNWVTITKVTITPDLAYLKAYFSVMVDNVSKKTVKQKLNAQRWQIKKDLANAHFLRTIPRISFKFDDTKEKVAELNSVLDIIHKEQNNDDEEENND